MMFASLACTFTWLPWHQTNLKLNTRAFNVVLRSTHMSMQNTNIPRMWTDSGKTHPWRPRGSQSGWEKRPDESFHYRAKEPLGTNSHRTISKNSSRCWLLIGHKKCFVLFCPIGEHISMSSFCVFVHNGYCLDHGLSSSCTKEMHAVRKLSVWFKIPIWSNSLTCQMQANSSELNFYQPYPSSWREWILLLLVHILHKTWN